MPTALGRRAWRRLAGAGTLAVLAGAGALGYELAGGPAVSGYRTTAATTGSVDKVLDLTGTATPVQRATLSFGVTGTVATVTVSVGQQVSAGETLATLTPSSLESQVTLDEASLRAAQASLTADETTQREGAAGAAATGAGRTEQTEQTQRTVRTAQTVRTQTSGSAVSNVAAAQQALTSAQQGADTAKQAATAALGVAQAACGTATAPGSKGKGTPPAKVTPAACSSDLAAALSAQEALSTAEAKVAEAETQLARLLASGATAADPGGTERAPADGGGTPAGTRARSTSSTSGTTPESMAAMVDDDQATVDSDEATLVDAQQSLAEATLETPIAGTVGALDLVKGQSAGGAQTVVATIVSQDSFEAIAMVPADEVNEISLGDRAVVDVDGRDGALHGAVVRIGPVDTDEGDEYPVVVALPSGAPQLFTGSLARVTVTVEAVHGVLCVPTSAVHTDGGSTTVDVLRAGRLSKVHVGTGLVGPSETQILHGLHAGEEVVLAVLTRPLPSPHAPAHQPTRGVFVVPGGGAFVKP